jgi:hypothetical protein
MRMLREGGSVVRCVQSRPSVIGRRYLPSIGTVGDASNELSGQDRKSGWV